MRMKKAPGTGTAESLVSTEKGAPQGAPHHPTALDRIVQRFEGRIRELEQTVVRLEAENRKLKRQIADQYDWSSEVNQETRWVG